MGPPVVEFLPEDGVLVIGFLEGETLSDEHLQGPGMMTRLADACRRLHAGPTFVNRFDMFELQPEYLARVQRRGFRLPQGYLAHADTVDRVRAALAARPVALRPCHNDLLAANFIDDGDTVWIIDPKTRVMCVYQIDSATGVVALKSVRNFHWDLQMSEFNAVSPLPREIRAMLENH